MAKVVIGEKTWDRFDYDITLWSDRGKGRAKIVRYQRRASSKDERTHNSLHIARIVMGSHLVGFLMNECYGTARLIPYVMLADTLRGNGCVCNDENGTTRWLCTKRGKIPEESLPEWIQKMYQMKKMIDLNELRYFGQYGINYDVDELIAENSMFNSSNFTKVLQTDEDEEVDVVEENGEERLVLLSNCHLSGECIEVCSMFNNISIISVDLKYAVPFCLVTSQILIYRENVTMCVPD